jgi:hypothetical protein
MITRTKENRDKALLTVNHSRMLGYEHTDDVSRTPVVQVYQAELEAIAAALRVRSGLQAGLQPCL